VPAEADDQPVADELIVSDAFDGAEILEAGDVEGLCRSSGNGALRWRAWVDRHGAGIQR